ncbi:MAG: SPOR domain-containing protein [Balneolaceae bacterium]
MFWWAVLFLLQPFTELNGQPIANSEGELILVRLSVENKISYDTDVYMLGDEVYLPVPYIFELLKIRYSSNKKNQFSIHFPNEKNKVLIDGDNNSNTDAIPDGINYEGDFYLSASKMERLFGFQFKFDYRKLTLRLNSKYSIPLIEEINRKNRYQSLGDDNNEGFAASHNAKKVSRKRYLANGLLADWAINNILNFNGSSNISGNLGLGGELLGGSINVHASASDQYGIHWESMSGNWTFPIQSGSVLKQIQIGDIRQPESINPVLSGFRGILLSNRPNLRPTFFSEQTFAGSLQDNWDVEFYVNRQLSDFQIGANQPDFNFNSPLFFGANHVMLKYYDEKGLHHEQNYLIHVPMEFLQPGKFEYDLSAGEYASLSGYNYAKANFKYGISSGITAGGGAFQNLNHSENDNTYPYLQTWLRASKRLTVSGSYMLNYAASGSLQYLFPSSQRVSFNVSKYVFNPVLNKSRKNYEASFNTSFPVQLFFLRFSNYYNIRYMDRVNSERQLNIRTGISTSLPFNINMRVNGNFILRDNNIAKVNPDQTNLDIQLSRRLWRNIFLRTNAKYSSVSDGITNAGLKIDYRVSSQLRIDMSFDRNTIFNTNQFLFRFRWDLPFARHTSYTRNNGGPLTLNQNTSGSILLNQNSRIKFDERKKIGRATLVINPFVDKNNNGKRDKDEAILEEIKASLYRHSRQQEIRTDERIVEHLVPYEHYTVEIDPHSLRDPLLKVRHASFSLQVLPNTINNLNVPLVIVGEVGGVVASENQFNDVYGLKINIHSLDGTFSDSSQTYTGGYYYYVGLPPGEYLATLDQKQLRERSITVEQDSIPFTIRSKETGDIADGVNFKIGDKEGQLKPESEQKYTEVYAVQIGAFKNRQRAERFAAQAESLLDEPVQTFFDESDEYFKCYVGDFNTFEKAKDKLFEVLEHYSYPFIIRIE